LSRRAPPCGAASRSASPPDGWRATTSGCTAGWPAWRGAPGAAATPATRAQASGGGAGLARQGPGG
jgi:hypothetical protein